MESVVTMEELKELISESDENTIICVKFGEEGDIDAQKEKCVQT